MRHHFLPEISLASASVNMRHPRTNISRVFCRLVILECVPLIVNIMKGAAFKTSCIDFLQTREGEFLK